MDDLDLGVTLKGFSPGQVVFKRFTLQRILGRGGMGVVWLARDEDLERNVALKFLPEVVALDRESVAELKRETRRNLDLTHPHIVRIYDFMQDAVAAAISMEYVNGASLSALKVDQAAGFFPLADVVRWATQLCEALSYAHGSARVVHRDLKPANLMIDAAGDLKVTDFGIACSIADSVSRVSKDIGSSGTPLYMSPQQMMGERPTPADDIYSLGATLYELLAGKPPFYTGNIILQVQSKTPPSLAERRRELQLQAGEVIPAEWEMVLAACLAKDPAARPPSIAAVAARLNLAGSFTAFVPAAPVASAVPPEHPVAIADAAPVKTAAPVAATSAPRRPKGVVFWAGLAAGILVVAGAAYWLGDGPNRLKAAQRMKTAQQALFAADWPAALMALRDAASLRPTDAEYRREFDEAQRRWVEMVEREIRDLAPRAAHDRLVSRAEAAIALVEPYAETFRRMSTQAAHAARALVQKAVDEARALGEEWEHDAALARLDEVRAHAALLPGFADIEQGLRRDRVRGGIAQAWEQVYEWKFAEAYATLEPLRADAALAGDEYATVWQQAREVEVLARLEEVELLAGSHRYGEALIVLTQLRAGDILLHEVERSTASVKALAQAFSVDRLSRALIAGQAAEVEAALQDYARFIESRFAVTGAELTGSRDLQTFLRFLEELRMRPKAGEPRTDGRDIALVSAVRARFADDGAVAQFLREELSGWSQVEEQAGRPGLALYLQAEAVREGAPADAARENRLRAALAADVGLRLSWAAADIEGKAAGPLRTDVIKVLQTRVEQRLAPIARFVSASDGPRTLMIATALSGPAESDKPTRQQRTVRYQSGTRNVTNPDYQQLQAQLRSAEDEVARMQNGLAAVRAEAQRQAQQAANSGNTNSAMAASLSGGIGITLAQNNLNRAVNHRNAVRNNLRDTSRTLSEPTYADEPYDVVTHNVTYSAALTAMPQGARSPARWTAQFAHQTTEITGNAARGVPVQAPVYPGAAEINRRLAEQLVARVGDLASLERSLATAGFALIKEQAPWGNASALDLADDQWGLLLLWRSLTIEPGEAAEIEQGVRLALGLPSR